MISPCVASISGSSRRQDAALRASPESASSALTPMEPQEAVGLQEVPSMKDPLAVLNAIHQVLVSAGQRG